MRFRTALAAVAVVGTALALGGLALVHLLSGSLAASADSAARVRAEALADVVAGGTLPSPMTVPGDDSMLVQVVDSSGRVVASSANIADEPAFIRPDSSRQIKVITAHGLPVSDQGMFRMATQSVDTPKGRLTVAAAASLAPGRHTVATIKVAVSVGLPIVLALVGLTAWLLAGRALAPVEAIRSQVSEISGRALDRRVPDPGGRDEIARLARTMNDMLARLERSQATQRRFVADASHELRSPLASALTMLQVDQAHPIQADWASTAAGIEAELQRLQRMLVDLLALARADEGAMAKRRGTVDLDEIVRDEASLQRVNSDVPIDTSDVVPVQVDAAPDELRRAVGNLLGNAVRHARGHVAVSLVGGPAGAVLVVADDGLGIPPGERDRVFGRFVRLDNARSRDTGGSGLGLAIAKEIIEAHGGTIVVGDARPGARFEVRFPPGRSGHGDDRDPGCGRGDAQGQPADGVDRGLSRGTLLSQSDRLP